MIGIEAKPNCEKEKRDLATRIVIGFFLAVTLQQKWAMGLPLPFSADAHGKLLPLEMLGGAKGRGLKSTMILTKMMAHIHDWGV